MPIVVSGIKELQRSMKQIEPELNKGMRQAIKDVMLPVRDKARGFLPANNEVLSGWNKALDSTYDSSKYRAFPKYDQTIAKQGIVYREGKNKTNQKGFSAVFYVANTSAPGAIYETAGRKSPHGSNESRSLNPNAGQQFIDNANRTGKLVNARTVGLRGRPSRMQTGRIVYRAWQEDKEKMIPLVRGIIQNVAEDFNSRQKQEAVAAIKGLMQSVPKTKD